MSLSGSRRRLSVALLAGVKRQGRGSMGGGGSEVGVQSSLPLRSSTSCGAHPFSVLQPHFHQGQSLGEGGSVSCRERSCRACSFTFSGLLQPGICGDESLGVMEASDRFVYPQSESPQDSLQDGDSPVCASVCTERRLDGFHRLEGRILAGPSTSGQSQIPQIRSFESSFSVQSSVFRSLYGSAGFHLGHGSGFSLSASLGYPHVEIPGRLVNPGLFSSSGSPGAGDGYPSVSGPWHCHQLGEVQSPSMAASGLSRCDSGLHSFQGFSLPAESREAVLNRRRIPVLRCTARLIVEKASGSSFISDRDCSGRQATDAISSTSSSPSVGSGGRFHLNSMGLGLSPRLGMVDCSRSFPVRHPPSSDQPSPRLLVRRLGLRVGRSPPGCYRFRPLVSGGSSIVHKHKGAPCSGVRSPAISSSGVQLHGSSVCGQFDSLGLPPQTGALDLRSSTPLLRGSSTGRSRSIWFWFPSSSRAGTMFWRTPCLAQTKSRGQSGL